MIVGNKIMIINETVGRWI